MPIWHEWAKNPQANFQVNGVHARLCELDYGRPSSTTRPRLGRPERDAPSDQAFRPDPRLTAVPAIGYSYVSPTEGREGRVMRKPTKVLDIVTGDILWAIILVPILAISWVGFYTIARAVGIPVIFAAGMSAAFDGVAIFAARIGLKHRRNGFSGYLARITVLAFVGIGVFVQSFHGRAEPWIHAHSWIVWSVAPIAACIAYELHLGWTNRKRLIKMGYYHPSAKSGFGPATWVLVER